MLMSFVYHRFHADRELSLLAGHAHPVGIDTANFTPLAMSVSRRECLQAGCNDCEFIGNEREQSVRLIGNESEQRNAIFASSPDYVCKLLHLNPQNFAIAIGKPRGRPWGPTAWQSGCHIIWQTSLLQYYRECGGHPSFSATYHGGRHIAAT